MPPFGRARVVDTRRDMRNSGSHWQHPPQEPARGTVQRRHRRSAPAAAHRPAQLRDAAHDRHRPPGARPYRPLGAARGGRLTGRAHPRRLRVAAGRRAAAAPRSCPPCAAAARRRAPAAACSLTPSGAAAGPRAVTVRDAAANRGAVTLDGAATVRRGATGPCALALWGAARFGSRGAPARDAAEPSRDAGAAASTQERCPQTSATEPLQARARVSPGERAAVVVRSWCVAEKRILPGQGMILPSVGERRSHDNPPCSTPSRSGSVGRRVLRGQCRRQLARELPQLRGCSPEPPPAHRDAAQ